VGILGATQAQANTYCALSATPGTCTTNYTNLATALPSAITDAQVNPGPDTVRIGAGTFTTTSGDLQLFGTGPNNAVNVVGESRPNTKLAVSNSTAQTIIFDGGNGSTLSNLTITIPGTITGGTGLLVRNTTGGLAPVVSDVNVNAVPASNPTNLTGVSLQAGSLVNSSVDVTSTNLSTAVASDGDGTQAISNSNLTGPRGLIQRGVSGALTASRVIITASQIGAETTTGTLNLNNSLIKMPPVATSTALSTTASGAGLVDTQVDGSTIVGGAGTTGAQLTAQTNPTASARLQLNNSVMSVGGNTFFAYIAGSSNAVAFNSDHSAYDKTKVVRFASSLGPLNTVEQNAIDLSTTSPGFTNAATGDYTPLPSSPLIDAGQPIDPPAGATDITGTPRACHGKADGLIIRDIGAFEYRTNPSDDCSYPAAVITPPAGPITDTTPTIALTSSKPGSTFTCSLDGAAFSSCAASFTTPALSLGAHDLKVRARDIYGNQQQVPTDAAFTIVAATCANTASLCPDKKAPTVKIISAPKRVKGKKATIKFSSSESGSKFTCKVNKAKAKSCKSPFKAKLKKGKNTITIVATDKAGNKSKAKKVSIRRK
jgi:hypothetical protein